jgi:DNA repair exonuclease SbcCD ATPase subunit
MSDHDMSDIAPAFEATQAAPNLAHDVGAEDERPLTAEEEQLYELGTGEMEKELKELRAIVEEMAALGDDGVRKHQMVQEKLQKEAEVARLEQKLKKYMGRVKELEEEKKRKDAELARKDDAMAKMAARLAELEKSEMHRTVQGVQGLGLDVLGWRGFGRMNTL